MSQICFLFFCFIKSLQHYAICQIQSQKIKEIEHYCFTVSEGKETYLNFRNFRGKNRLRGKSIDVA